MNFSFLEKEPEEIKYLSLFRIIIGIILLANVFCYLSNWRMIFSPNSFYEFFYDYNWLTILFKNQLDVIRSHFNYFLLIFQFIITLFIFGIGRNATTFLVFLMLYITQSFNPLIINGGDNYLIFILLYLSFSDSFRYYALKPSSPTAIKNVLTNIGIFNIKFHLCLIYFISAISKMHSDVWYNGVASYYTLNLERFRGTSVNSYIANNGYIVTISTYGVLLLELVFPFLIWFKKPRFFLIVGGILMHLFILIFMMIFDFELIFISIYGLFISKPEWKYLKQINIIKLISKAFLKIKLTPNNVSKRLFTQTGK